MEPTFKFSNIPAKPIYYAFMAAIFGFFLPLWILGIFGVNAFNTVSSTILTIVGAVILNVIFCLVYFRNKNFSKFDKVILILLFSVLTALLAIASSFLLAICLFMLALGGHPSDITNATVIFYILVAVLLLSLIYDFNPIYWQKIKLSLKYIIPLAMGLFILFFLYNFLVNYFGSGY
jgi:hypothetical protein